MPAWTPAVLPYDVTVLSGLILDRQVVDVVVPFGQVPATQTIAATLPAPLVSWGARDTSDYLRLEQEPVMLVSSIPSGGSATGVVSLALDAAPPGTYTRSAKVFTNVTDTDGMSLHFERTVTVTNTVTPDASVDAVFTPAAGNFTRVQGDTLAHYANRTLATNTGVTATWRGVEYLSHPPAAEGHPQVNSWWFEHPFLLPSPCYVTLDSSNCLPPGTYTARVRYSLVKEGVESDIYWPITLEVVPR
jgi:hypothetical protein